jgi:GTP pyrophosphokinase
LKNGDIVEIQTQTGHTPSRDWLSFVKTSRSEQDPTFHQCHSAGALNRDWEKDPEKEARKFKVNLKKLVEEGHLLKAAPDYGCTKLEDVYSALGFGKISARVLLGKLVAPGELEEAPDEKVSKFTSAVKKVLGFASGATIQVKGADDLLVYRAKCCNPIRGEDIVGYITRGKGVAVHARRCANRQSDV